MGGDGGNAHERDGNFARWRKKIVIHTRAHMHISDITQYSCASQIFFLLSLHNCCVYVCARVYCVYFTHFRDVSSPTIFAMIHLPLFCLFRFWLFFFFLVFLNLCYLDMRATRSLKNYSCCPNPYVDITFTIFVRRRTVYYIVNLILPSVTLAAMAMLGFTLSSDCGEKMTLGTYLHGYMRTQSHTS